MTLPSPSGIHTASPVSSAARPDPDPALRKAAQGFEAVFLREIISTMREAKLAEDVFGSSATDSFRQMSDANLADGMSQLGQFGIAEMIEQQFARLSGNLSQDKSGE